MNIVITGGFGYVGRYLTARLLDDGHEVWVLDNASVHTAEELPDGLMDRVAYHLDWDVRDTYARNAGLPFGSPTFAAVNAVVHLAALCYPGESVERPTDYWSVNVGGTLALLWALPDRCRFVFASSCAANEPASPYGRSKLAAEQAIQDCRSDAVILRLGNVAGRNDPNRRLIPMLARGELETIYGAAVCNRWYVHVDDVVEACRIALLGVGECLGRTWGVCAANAYTADVVFRWRELGGTLDPWPESKPVRPWEQVASGPGVEALPGWRPQHGLDDMLLSAMEAARCTTTP